MKIRSIGPVKPVSPKKPFEIDVKLSGREHVEAGRKGKIPFPNVKLKGAA